MPRVNPLRRLGSERRGATALEFALISLPLFVFLAAILQMALHFYWQQSLDYAVHQAGRQVQIGNVGANYTAATFANQVLCPTLPGFSACSNLFIGLHPVTDYQQLTGAGVPDAPDSTGISGLVFCSGKPGQLMYAHVVFLSPSLLGGLLGGGDFDPIVANTAFTNENPTGSTVTQQSGC